MAVILESHRSQHKYVHYHSCTGRHYTLHSQYQLDPNTDMPHYTVHDMTSLQQLYGLKYLNKFSYMLQTFVLRIWYPNSDGIIHFSFNSYLKDHVFY